MLLLRPSLSPLFFTLSLSPQKFPPFAILNCPVMYTSILLFHSPQVLRRILGVRWTEVTGGASLIAVLGSVDSGKCDEETKQRLQEFVDR